MKQAKPKPPRKVAQAQPPTPPPARVAKPARAVPTPAVAAPQVEPAGASDPIWPLVVAGGLLFAVAVSLAGYVAARRSSG